MVLPPLNSLYLYKTPNRVGAVRIVDVDSNRLILATVDQHEPATTFTFDLARREFVLSSRVYTWDLELIDCGINNFPELIEFRSCWSGMHNGEEMGIRSGRRGTEGDQTQGILVVFHGLEWHTPLTEFYETPRKVGAVQIVSIHGPRITLASEDGQTTFVFDLNMRHWINQ